MLLLALAASLSFCPPAKAAPTVIDQALYTDIVARINGHPLRSFNVSGYTAIPAEDLRGYGFRVLWDEESRTLQINRRPWGSKYRIPQEWPAYTPKPPAKPVGTPAQPVYSTDIRTYLDGKLVASFNIGGKTLLWLKDLACFGSLVWDAEARTSSLTLDDRAPEKALYVLMYHDISEWSSPEGDWTTSVELFRSDLQWLQENGFTCYLPGELASGAPISDKAVMITFDDGYRSNYTLAFPLLREYGMKAAVCVICERIDSGHPDFLTWDMCREMAASGLIEFGSHTYDLHDGIHRLSGESDEAYGERVYTDIAKSVETLRAQVGQDVVFFAYPHGTVEPRATEYLSQQFSVTVTTEEGYADAAKGLYNLPRCNINARQTAAFFLSEYTGIPASASPDAAEIPDFLEEVLP